ncbi:PhoX family phosphatase [Sphingomonas sp. R-74633]|uniref:PhoX family protein n=1 Tax=Sphingomonas sp. R-74633 TaxID=2751188 RepID=UPI0015D1BFEF|nr:PhoX family phosphatase [Sphingomonas sp. R-74633]NYT42064.1 PhoX family phosphatase [Sphingomonas sp. R-74633]
MTNLTETGIGYTDGDVDTNIHNSGPTLGSLIEQRYSRRDTLQRGGAAIVAATMGSSVLAACDSNFDDNGTGPTVSAGTNGATTSGKPVTLTGTGSASAYAWTQVAGPTVTLTGADTLTASFIAPSVSAATTLSFQLAAANSSGPSSISKVDIVVSPAVLGFTAIAKNKLDVVSVPAGYTVTVINRTGDPILPGVAAYKNDGTDTNFAGRIGDHGDALYWYGLNAAGARDATSSTRGLIVQNHENINQQYLHVAGATAGVRPESEAIKEIECHGVSVTEVSEGAGRAWAVNATSAFNRRLTPSTPMVFNGPVKGSDFLKTAFSTDGTTARGTINNCANGTTPWGTALTCEENWAGYFRRATTDVAGRTAKELTALTRYGVTGNGNYGWSTVVPADASNTLFRRWDARVTGATATDDFRNEPNLFGWVVEIDPYDKTKAPRKRTALGRMGHEGCWPGAFVVGKKPAWYMGDDAVNEYLYKFVSNTAWVAADADATDRLSIGDKYLDAGTLYVAVFNADGTGAWKALTFGSNGIDASYAPYAFANQVDVLVNPRLAADAAGATPMDRPEWTAVNPVTGDVYLTLTNNANRVVSTDTPTASQRRTDAANPRVYVDPPKPDRGNRNGHIIRLKETGGTTDATAFTWDIYLFGSGSDLDATNINVSGLTADQDFSSPDGLYFSRASNAAGQVKPLLWFQTDDSAFTDVTNCMMLAAMPGTVGDGGARTITNSSAAAVTSTQATRVGAAPTAATLKRFLVGPLECEITGVDSTPDGRTLFVGIQHPGENGTPAAPSSHWPDSQATGTAGATIRPRSAVVVITKNDGGLVGL